MSSFAEFLADRVESYVALRRSLGYAFRKSAAILRALARYVADEDLDFFGRRRQPDQVEPSAAEENAVIGGGSR